MSAKANDYRGFWFLVFLGLFVFGQANAMDYTEPSPPYIPVTASEETRKLADEQYRAKLSKVGAGAQVPYVWAMTMAWVGGVFAILILISCANED